MKVSLIQMNSQENKDANLKKAEELIAQAVAEDHPDMVVLPEMFTCLTESDEVRRANADTIPGGETYDLLRDLPRSRPRDVHRAAGEAGRQAVLRFSACRSADQQFRQIERDLGHVGEDQ